METPVVFIIGTTAVGKTQLSIDLCKSFGGEVVSADSMQIYQYADLMTAKATEEERAQVPHHMLDLISPVTDAFDIRTYQRMALESIQEVVERGKLPVVVGGTLYYVESLLFERDLDAAVWETSQFEETSNHELYAQLTEVDPVSAKLISASDRRRLINALGYCNATGQSYSTKDTESKLRFSNTIVIWLKCPPDVLEARVRDRTSKMLEKGGLDEIERILSLEPERGFTKGVLQSIGYKEFEPYFKGKGSLPDCTEALIKATLKYTKKQLKWIRTRLAPHLQLVLIDTSAPWLQVAEIATQAIRDGRTVSCASFTLSKPHTFNCEKCSRTLRGESEWRSHLRSKGHRRR